MDKILILILCLLVRTFAYAQTADQLAIQESFTAYQLLLAKGETAQAMNYSTASTRQYFADLLTKAKRLKKNQLLAAPISDKIAILSLRQATTDAELRAMKPSDLFAQQNKGMMIQGNSRPVQLSNITVSGNKATATIATTNNTGKPGINFPLQFLKESNIWRFDLVSLLAKANAMMALMGNNFNTEQQLMKLLEMQGKKVDASIWNTIE